MSAHQAEFPIAAMARVLGVSPSGYYAWRHRQPSQRAQADQALTDEIEAIYAWSRQSYGAPRIHAELQDRGVRVARKRVARLMRAASLRGVCRRKRPRTTRRSEDARPAPDLVERAFTAEGPNELWVGDITYVRTGEGFLYLAVVVDVFSRRVVGWAMADHLRSELVVAALDMAVDQRDPAVGVDGVIHHSDQGCQYTSQPFARHCTGAGVQVSMGSVGDCFDNALCESFFATLECELLDRVAYATRSEARLSIFDYIEGWYNPHRRHSALDYLSPINYEKRHEAELAVPSR